jgi:hypothetical protein
MATRLGTQHPDLCFHGITYPPPPSSAEFPFEPREVGGVSPQFHSAVLAGPVPAIHEHDPLPVCMGGRDKPGHDGLSAQRNCSFCFSKNGGWGLPLPFSNAPHVVAGVSSHHSNSRNRRFQRADLRQSGAGPARERVHGAGAPAATDFHEFCCSFTVITGLYTPAHPLENASPANFRQAAEFTQPICSAYGSIWRMKM